MGNLLFIIFCAMTLANMVVSKQFSSFPHGTLDTTTPKICNGLLGECLHEEEMSMESALMIKRRIIETKRYISYDALEKDNPPCNNRGQSYYGCGRSEQANPYYRGCSVITHCARDTS
ncbi:putative rapid ALkalinization Factor [Lupinus albus]|uniref:Putative rapid ALkalinization Factor n=1 Tax=Lupinus albus TaxID=3870 RepID=A0A6A4PES4_LUPAL|nr:putative rapid ALkalinization Factor [Lupinus albus]